MDRLSSEEKIRLPIACTGATRSVGGLNKNDLLVIARRMGIKVVPKMDRTRLQKKICKSITPLSAVDYRLLEWLTPDEYADFKEIIETYKVSSIDRAEDILKKLGVTDELYVSAIPREFEKIFYRETAISHWEPFIESPCSAINILRQIDEGICWYNAVIPSLFLADELMDFTWTYLFKLDMTNKYPIPRQLKDIKKYYFESFPSYGRALPVLELIRRQLEIASENWNGIAIETGLPTLPHSEKYESRLKGQGSSDECDLVVARTMSKLLPAIVYPDPEKSIGNASRFLQLLSFFFNDDWAHLSFGTDPFESDLVSDWQSFLIKVDFPDSISHSVSLFRCHGTWIFFDSNETDEDRIRPYHLPPGMSVKDLKKLVSEWYHPVTYVSIICIRLEIDNKDSGPVSALVEYVETGKSALENFYDAVGPNREKLAEIIRETKAESIFTRKRRSCLGHLEYSITYAKHRGRVMTHDDERMFTNAYLAYRKSFTMDHMKWFKRMMDENNHDILEMFLRDNFDSSSPLGYAALKAAMLDSIGYPTPKICY